MVKLPRFQFRLRSLMIFMAIVAIPCAWLGHKSEQKRKEREAVKRIVSLGGQVFYDYQKPWYAPNLRCWFLDSPRQPEPPGPEWLRKWLGNDFFSDAVFAVVSTDAETENLAELSRLRDLSFSNPALITDAGLVHIQGLSSLRNLDLGGTKVTDIGIASLCDVTQLETLSLAGTRITDAALSYVKPLTRLQRLGLAYTSVSNNGLATIKGLKQLQTLTLGKTGVDDAGLEHLNDLTRLGDLSLYGSRISDAGLAHLKGLVHLKNLDLRETAATDAGVADLQKALPNCNIEH